MINSIRHPISYRFGVIASYFQILDTAFLSHPLGGLGATYNNHHVEGVAPSNHSSSQKTRLNDLSYGTCIQIWTDLSSVLCNPRV